VLQRRHILYGMLALGAVACAGDKAVTGPGQEIPRLSLQTITPPGGTRTLVPTASNQGIPEQTVVSYAEQTLVTVQATGIDGGDQQSRRPCGDVGRRWLV